MRRSIYTNDFNDFLGLGFGSDVTGGQLDGDIWSVTGFSSTADFARGLTSSGVSTGGIYAVDKDGAGDNGLLIQPTGSDFTPGNLTLSLNSGIGDLTDVVVSFDRLVNNNATRANAFDFSYSLDGTTFISLNSFVSSAASDAAGLTSETVTVMLPDLAANTDFQLRWSGADVSGGGSRDEFGIDNLSVDGLEATNSDGVVFTLELLHIADQEASSAAVVDAPNLSAVLNSLRAQDLGDDGEADNTLTLSSGDAIIPGIFFDASEAVFGSAGVGDILIQNELGIQAMALGNHEFDQGTSVLSDLISGDAAADFDGTAFPYLSTNLDFSTDTNLAPLEVAGGGSPLAGTVTSSVVLETNGEKIGVIGATTPTLGTISNPDGVTVLPADFDATPTAEQLDALAAVIQAEVDAVLAADTNLNKIVLLAHMQVLSIEQELAARLENVDIVVAGGSNTRLFDENDRPRDGDTAQGDYPIFVENAGGTQTAVVNTDGSYKYVGRLVIGFDDDGNIVPGSYDPDVSGAYATDAQGVADLGAEGLIDPEIQAIANAIEAQIIATESNVFGSSEVFLNGNRSGVEGDEDGVRTQETNLGNLTADANLASAQEADSTVVVSIKNGGGIRASIGETVVLPGDVTASRLPNEEIRNANGELVKPAGGISETDIQATLAFNNGLTLLTLTRAELVAVLEHGVSALPDVAGQFPQVSGVEFSFDPDLPAGSRILNAEIVDGDGTRIAELVRDGELSGDPVETFRIVTLNFLAGGGDGYPFPQGAAADRVDLAQEETALRTGDATFAEDGTEQDALAEYLAGLAAPFAEADTTQADDTRIQNLNFRADTVFDDDVVVGDAIVINEILASTTSTDSEYIELFGAAGASLSGLSVIGVEGNDAATPGTIDFQFDFSDGDVIGANGFFLLANQTAQDTYQVTPNATLTASLENSSATYALVETASLTGGSVTGSETVIDTVALFDSSDSTAFFGAPAVGPDGTFFPAGVGRIEDGVDTDTAADFEILSFFNDTDTNTPTAGTAPDVVVINEVLASTTSSDSEYIELFGTPGASLAGLSFVEVESNDAATPGTIDFRFDFADDAVLGDNGFLLLANAIAQGTYAVEANITITDSLENSSATYALVETASLNGDSVTGNEVVIDTVASVDTTASTPAFGAPVVGPDGNFFPAGVGRVEDGVDTDSADDFEILSFNNDTETNTPTPGTGLDGSNGGGGGSIDDAPTAISAVQGSGDASELVGQTVVIEAIVTGDFQNGDGDTFRDLGGFFLMEELDDRDTDASTSEGIFAFEGNGDLLTDVDDGDRVRVLGTVVERFNKTAIEVTEIRIEEADAVDPLSLAVTTALPDTDGREAFESMLVTIDESLTFSESFDYEDFGDATLSTDGPVYQFTQQNAPDVAANAAHQEEVADRTITISGGGTGRRADFDPITEPDGDLINGPTEGVRMGQSTTGLTAILDFDFGEFRLRLPEEVPFELDASTNPVPEAPEDVGSDFKVGSLNVLNYFTTLDGQTANGNNPRGADDQEELDRQTDKLVQTIVGMDADVIGLVEIENDFEGDEFALKTLVDEINASVGPNIWGFVDPGTAFVGDDAIAVAFIYDTTTVNLVGDAAILDTDAFLDPLGTETGGDGFNRAALAQTFEEVATGGQFTASVNHFKSKGSLTGATEDEDQGDGAGNNNATRTEAARELAEWLATDPTASGDEDVLILGDLNAYARETPITTLNDAGYTDLAANFEGEDVYSYRFSGQIGTLDYALANEALFEQVTGATTWNINSDTPVFYDYNTDDTFTGPNTFRPTDQGLFDKDSPLRGSDHDPVIVGLNLDDDRVVEDIVIAGDSGNDRLNGTDADEIIIGGGGRLDVVSGGGGIDTFVFTDLDNSRDQLRILDFDVALDILALSGSEIASTRALGNNLLITLDEDRDSIFLTGVNDINDVTVTNDTFLFT